MGLSSLSVFLCVWGLAGAEAGVGVAHAWQLIFARRGALNADESKCRCLSRLTGRETFKDHDTCGLLWTQACAVGSTSNPVSVVMPRGGRGGRGGNL